MLGAALTAGTSEYEAGTPRRGRARAVLAVFIDLVTLVMALGAGLALATVWLLARSEAGAVDPRGGDAVLGWALWSAAAPAWSVWQFSALRGEGRTRGARVASALRSFAADGVAIPRDGGFPSEPSPQPSPLRGEGVRVGVLYLFVHPTALPLLGWAALCLVLTPVWVLETAGLLLAVVVGLLALVAVASGGRGLLRPEATPLYAGLARRLGGLGRGRA